MISRLTAFLPELSQAVRRFPEATLAAASATLLSCLVFSPDRARTLAAAPWLDHAYFAVAAVFPVLFAAGLYAERHGTTPLRRIGHAVLAASLIGLLVAFQDNLDLSRPLLIAWVLLLPALAAHVGRARDNASFWLFNHDLWLGLGMALIGAGLLALSIAAIFATLAALFQIEFGEAAYTYNNAIAAHLAGPLMWLTLAPRAEPASAPAHAPAITPVQEGDDAIIPTGQTSSQAIALVAKFILVPVLFIYTVIIYFYAAKIAIDGALPNGQIGWMVLLYGAAGTATLLAIYPTRQTGGFLVSVFDRYWFAMVLLPVTLLFIAVFTRTGYYGVTDKRYLVILAGVWLILQAPLFGLRPQAKRDLRMILGSLATLIAIAMAGPWGALGSTTRLLASDFRGFAAASAAFKDGAFENERLDTSQRTRLLSIVKYLGENGRLDLIYPVIRQQNAAEKFDVTPASSLAARREQAARFAGLAGLPGYFIEPATFNSRTYFNFYAAKPLLLESGDHLAGPFVLSQQPGTIPGTIPAPSAAVNDAQGHTASATLTPNTVSVVLDGNRSATFDAAVIAEALKEGQSKPYGSAEAPHFTARDDASGIDIVIVHGTGSDGATGFELTSLTFWIMWRGT